MKRAISKLYLHPVSKRMYGRIVLNRKNQSEIVVEVYDAEKYGTMKTMVEPSYAVNPPYLQYDKCSTSSYGYGPAKVEDKRFGNIESNIRRALTGHGVYATESEIKLVLDAAKTMLKKIDTKPANLEIQTPMLY